MPDTEEALTRLELIDQLIVATKALKRSAYQHTPTYGEGSRTPVNVNRCRICGVMSVGMQLVVHRAICTVPPVQDLLRKLKELNGSGSVSISTDFCGGGVI
jgi:hypothetical protein